MIIKGFGFYEEDCKNEVEKEFEKFSTLKKEVSMEDVVEAMAKAIHNSPLAGEDDMMMVVLAWIASQTVKNLFKDELKKFKEEEK